MASHQVFCIDFSFFKLEKVLPLFTNWTNHKVCIRAPPQIFQHQVQPLDHSLCVGKNFFPGPYYSKIVCGETKTIKMCCSLIGYCCECAVDQLLVMCLAACWYKGVRKQNCSEDNKLTSN